MQNDIVEGPVVGNGGGDYGSAVGIMYQPTKDVLRRWDEAVDRCAAQMKAMIRKKQTLYVGDIYESHALIRLDTRAGTIKIGSGS